jgi:hypothetical protein
VRPKRHSICLASKRKEGRKEGRERGREGKRERERKDAEEENERERERNMHIFFACLKFCYFFPNKHP